MKLREAILEKVHTTITRRHVGENKALSSICASDSIGWEWRRTWKNGVAGVRCTELKKVPMHKNNCAPLRMYQAGAPMESVAVDVPGPLSFTMDGN